MLKQSPYVSPYKQRKANPRNENSFADYEHTQNQHSSVSVQGKAGEDITECNENLKVIPSRNSNNTSLRTTQYRQSVKQVTKQKMNITIDKFEQRILELETASKFHQPKKQTVMTPCNPTKKTPQSPKKRILTSKPKAYVPPGYNNKFVNQSPMDYGRIQKPHTDYMNSQLFTRKSSNADIGAPQNRLKLQQSANGVPPAPQSPKKRDIILMEDEQKKYGRRCPQGYKTTSILGKGGIALVWLAIDLETGQEVAIKQFPKVGRKFDSSASIEIQIQSILQETANDHNIPGIDNICKLLNHVEDKKDLWLVYEVCKGQTMNEELFNVKGEFYSGERIYRVHHSIFYHSLRNNQKLMIDFLKRMAQVFHLFDKAGVVHADLKPDNIIIDFDEESQEIKTLKIIDFGSSFLLNADDVKLREQMEFGQSTPEYLPPEIQMYLIKKFTPSENVEISQFSEIAFVFDVWSLGSILIEILSGFPLWLSLKSRITTVDGRSIINHGIFGVSGRDNGKILKKQNVLFGDKGGMDGINKVKQALKKNYDSTGCKLFDNHLFNQLMAGILEVNPEMRMRPSEILESEFLNQEI